jgi:hypothetical protein
VPLAQYDEKMLLFVEDFTSFALEAIFDMESAAFNDQS